MGIKNGLLKIANWFQPAYNKIDEWDLPWLRKACEGLWGILDGKIKKKLYDLVMDLTSKYGDSFAKEFIEETMAKLTTLILGRKE